MERPENRRRLYFFLIAAAGVAAVLIGAYLFYYRTAPPRDYVGSTGVIEATEVDLSPEISGRIEWLCCEEGDRLEAGGLAIRLESSQLEARVEEGRAVISAAGEALKESRVSLENALLAKQTAGFELEAAEAEAARTAALRDEAADNFERARGLFAGGFIPEKELDSAEAAFEAASALYASAAARAKGAEARLRNSDVEIKAAKVRISSAQAGLRQAEAQLKVLTSVLSDTRVRSPINGVVAYKAFETGEFAGAGASVYTVYDLDDIWARVDISETFVEKFRLGSRAEVRAPGSPGRVFGAMVTEVGEVAGFATQRDVTRGRPDIKTFRIKAKITEPGGFLKPGMTVEVRIYFTSGG